MLFAKLAEPFVVYLCITYATLLVLYVGGGMTITFVNARRQVRKIQDRPQRPGQTRRDIQQSLRSLLSIATFMAAGLTLTRAGHGRFPTPTLTWWNFPLQLLASMLLFDTWFYWAHRLLHKRPFFERVHLLHHKSKTPNVWSNNSDSLLDNCFLQSYWFIAMMLLPIHPAVFIVHKIYDQISGMLGHAGYEYAGKLALPPISAISTTHHDMHHEYVRYNFATHFTHWDKWAGTLHRDYDAHLRRNLAI